MSTPDESTASLETAALIGALFAAARKRSGISQREITRRTGLARSALFHIEKGARKNNDDEVRPVGSGTGTLAKLADLFQLTAEEFAQLARWGRPDVGLGVLAIKLGLNPDDSRTYVLLEGLMEVRARVGSPGEMFDWVMLATRDYQPGQANPGFRAAVARAIAGR